MIEHKTQPATDSRLHRLLKECQDQLRAFVHGASNRDDSASCAEIVNHASRANDTALTMLFELIAPLIRQKVSRNAQIDSDDVVQNVSLRLLCRFRNQNNPYKTTTFAAFRTYLNLTIRSVVLNTIERERVPNISVEQLQQTHGIELANPTVVNTGADTVVDNTVADTVTTNILLDQLLTLLSDPLERDALRRRYIYQETPVEIAQALQKIDPAITKKDVYRYVERGLRRLVNHPLVLQLKDDL